MSAVCCCIGQFTCPSNASNVTFNLDVFFSERLLHAKETGINTWNSFLNVSPFISSSSQTISLCQQERKKVHEMYQICYLGTIFADKVQYTPTTSTPTFVLWPNWTTRTHEAVVFQPMTSLLRVDFRILYAVFFSCKHDIVWLIHSQCTNALAIHHTSVFVYMRFHNIFRIIANRTRFRAAHLTKVQNMTHLFQTL